MTESIIAIFFLFYSLISALLFLHSANRKIYFLKQQIDSKDESIRLYRKELESLRDTLNKL